ncbi:hypothetical protein [Nocardia sp. NPDC049190]|uniref:hypothetical protein n=1 Tax=Bacillati TaxID=1783272 RepID=UPI0033E0A5B3
MITEDQRVEMIGAITEIVLERLLLKSPPTTIQDYQERNRYAGLLIGRLMAAVVHDEPEIGLRYLELSKECEKKGQAMTGKAERIGRRSALRVV